MNKYIEKEYVAPHDINILSIDAWRDPDGGWLWNNWHKVGTISSDVLAPLKTNRALLAWMRKNDFISPVSAGKVAVDDDGFNIVILAKGTREPLYAIEYGAHI